MSILDKLRLDGKSVFITGGSRGLGREMVLGLADAGADITMVARNLESLEQTAADVRNLGRRATCIAADMADPITCEGICQQALAEHGPFDILVNNIGGRRANVALQDMPLDQWQSLIDLNLTATFLCCKHIGGAMIARGQDPFGGFSQFFQRADIRIGNLECVVATTGSAGDKNYTFRAHPRTLPVLRRHFDALALANNHSGDFGKDAFLETMQHVDAAGIARFGGGRNLTEAHAPLWIRQNGLKVAVLSYNEFKPRSFEAGADTPGIAWSEDSQVVADIRAARRAGRREQVSAPPAPAAEAVKLSGADLMGRELFIDSATERAPRAASSMFSFTLRSAKMPMFSGT